MTIETESKYRTLSGYRYNIVDAFTTKKEVEDFLKKHDGMFRVLRVDQVGFKGYRIYKRK
jgi:hypothetical protein